MDFFAYERSFKHFRLGPFGWELQLGNFAWELSPQGISGNSRGGSQLSAPDMPITTPALSISTKNPSWQALRGNRAHTLNLTAWRKPSRVGESQGDENVANSCKAFESFNFVLATSLIEVLLWALFCLCSVLLRSPSS